MSSFLEILKCNKNCVKNISKYLRLLSEIDVEKDKQEYVKKALDGLLYIPFTMGQSGSRIIYSTPEM